jgi:poly(3-hydroxybutyrate) depolymerase
MKVSLGLLGQAVSLFASGVLGAELRKVEEFGVNPSNASMYIYVPEKFAEKPAVVVAVS